MFDNDGTNPVDLSLTSSVVWPQEVRSRLTFYPVPEYNTVFCTDNDLLCIVGTAAGAVDETDFVNSYEDCPDVRVRMLYSSNDGRTFHFKALQNKSVLSTSLL